MKLTINQTNSILTAADFAFLDTLYGAVFQSATKFDVEHEKYKGALYELHNSGHGMRTILFALFLEHQTTKKIIIFTVERFEFEEEYAFIKTTYFDSKLDKNTREHEKLQQISAERSAFIAKVNTHLAKHNDE